MVALTQTRALDFAAASPEAARSAIREALAAEPAATRRVYAALAHKVWSLLVERRFDGEIRDWHALLQQVKTHVRNQDTAVAERVTALADLLRESISLSETSPAREVARRPNARRILEMLAKADGLVPRRKLLEALGMRSANLSNVLTQLLAHNLVDRRDKGKEAEFRLTRFGRQLLESEDKPVAKSSPPALGRDVDQLVKLLAADTLEASHDNVWIDHVVHLSSLALPQGRHGTISFGDPTEDVFMPRTGATHRAPGRTHSPVPVGFGYRHDHSTPIPLLPAR